MSGGRDSAVRGGRDGRGGRRGGTMQMMINGVDVLDPNRNFAANEWTSLSLERWTGVCFPGAGVHERKREWRPRWRPWWRKGIWTWRRSMQY